MRNLFHYKIEELNDEELKIYGDYMVDTAITIKKEWIGRLINSIRKLTPDDFNIDYNEHSIKFDDADLLFWNSIEERDLSIFNIRINWKDTTKNAIALMIPYMAPNKYLIMEFIEPLLCELAKYLPEVEQKKLIKPWKFNMTFEEWQVYEKSNKPEESEIRFLGEIDPKDYFVK